MYAAEFHLDQSLVATVEQAYTLQEDLHKLNEWSLEWQMLFNTVKCKVLHFGYTNPRYDYYMADDLIESVSEEKDLGVLIHESLNLSFQCATVVKTANRVLGMIRRAYDYRSKENIVSLYKSLVRPHLDYCVQAWRTYYQKDIDNIEKVQRRALQMINGLERMSYESRLEKAGLMTLETRRLRADLLEVFKIMHGLEGLEPSDFLC